MRYLQEEEFFAVEGRPAAGAVNYTAQIRELVSVMAGLARQLERLRVLEREQREQWARRAR